KGYAKMVYANYTDTISATEQLLQEVRGFVEKPSQSGLKKARSAWVQARHLYGQTEVYRFYGGPIDGESGPEGRMNAWPMDEAYVDYVRGAPKAGLIQNTEFEINAENLSTMNERGGEENVATGWHAIEFLLWGQDLSENSAGQRPYTDYVSAPFAERRALYLETATELLLSDLKQLAKAWAPNQASNYRAQFEEGGKQSLQNILIGMGSLSRGELAGERMEVALFSMQQEDEHSCFSDNTHRDIQDNAQGILNVWLGRYEMANGQVLQVPSLQELVRQESAEVARQTTEQLKKTVALSQKIKAPFDREISGGQDGQGRERLQSVVDSLIAQSEWIVTSASAVDLEQLTLAKP
ncbi:MAG: imelysin family protein, partial [Limnobacter sp.]|nr:imelysin family protein [Limnobacter sp.]